MAANLLPIIAIAGAAFFLMKKKETPGTGGNGTSTNGNGANGTHGNGGNGNGPGQTIPVKTPEDLAALTEGYYGMKVGEALTLEPASETWYFKFLYLKFNDASLTEAERDKLVTFNKDEHSGQILSVTFRPDKTGAYSMALQSWSRLDPTSEHPAWIYGMNFMVT